MSDFEQTMRITRLEGQVRDLTLLASRQSNFLEALGITLLDEENYDEAAKMLRQALGREELKEDDDDVEPT